MAFEVYCYIPSNFDSYLESHPPSFRANPDVFYYILHHVGERMDYVDLDESLGFINIHGKTLRKLIWNYNKYLDYLVENNVLVTDNTFIQGAKSRGYKLSPEYLESFTEVLLSPGNFKNKVRALRSELKEEQKASTSRLHSLTQWFNSRLTINSEEAKKEVDRLFPKEVHTGGIHARKRVTKQEGRYKALLAIHKVSKGEFHCRLDDNIGRFHSNLTNIKKELRKFITYDGQELVNLDIRNSQPFFSLLLLRADFYKKGPINIRDIPSVMRLEKVTRKEKKYKIDKIKFDKIIEAIYYYIIVQVSPETQAGRGFSKYPNIVVGGNFYDKLMDIFAGKGHVVTRDQAKIEVLRIFFSDNRFFGHKKAAMKRIFKQEFPEVYEVFSRLKKLNNTILSHLLQRIESRLIIETICKRISKEKPNVPIYTIHDSIACPSIHKDYVKNVMKEEILRVTGYTCQIGEEYWKS